MNIIFICSRCYIFDNFWYTITDAGSCKRYVASNIPSIRTKLNNQEYENQKFTFYEVNWYEYHD